MSATRIRYPISCSSSESQRHGSSGPAPCRMLVCYAADNMSLLLAGTACTFRMYLICCFNRRAQLPGKRVDLATPPTVIIRDLSSPTAQTMYNSGYSRLFQNQADILHLPSRLLYRDGKRPLRGDIARTGAGRRPVFDNKLPQLVPLPLNLA